MNTTAAQIEYIETPTTTAEILIAADIGNARADILVQLGDRAPSYHTMPAVRSLDIVFARDIFERRGLAPDAYRQLAADEHILRRDDLDRFVGRLAVEYARAQSGGRGSDHRYSDGTTQELIFAGIGAALPTASKIAVRCATLLPIKLWASHRHAVENALRTRSTYHYNGRPIEATFDQVLVLREGEAAYHALDKKPQGAAVIVDGGGRTFNIALFDNGEYIDGTTIDNMGVEVVFDSLDRQLEVDNLRRLRFDERLELQSAMVAGLPYSISHRQQAHRIDTRARKLFDAAAATLVQELHRTIDIDQAEGGALVGGAAFPCFFGDVVSNSIAVLQIAESPNTRNVFGALAKLSGQPTKKARRK